MSKKIKEIIVYIIGMAVLGLGLCLSTKLSLGTSALIALPFSISSIYNLNFGNITLIYYIIFIIIQIIIHLIMKKYTSIIGDISQIIVSLILTRYLNLLSNLIPIFSEYNIIIRVLLYLIPIVLVGIGVALIVKTKYPPNPSNGVIKTMRGLWVRNGLAEEWARKDLNEWLPMDRGSGVGFALRVNGWRWNKKGD